MCGIVGVLSFSDSKFVITESYLERMRDTMVHRGPDGAGTWVSQNRKVGLGHRRLSIIDLSDAAAQPMCNEDETLWVSFNGEIYNHAEVRSELDRIGSYKWKTNHSDTEVILHAFEQWGIDCIQKFRGMFAIALWDGRARQLWLIRDRIGVKPLYYCVHHGRLTFASEIKALIQDPDQKRVVHEEAFYHYLSFLTTPAPQSLFDGIKKVPPGSWLRIDENGRVQEQRYWDVWDHVTPLSAASEGEISERILSELRTAVRLRKVSDVPVGVFLSGGIDSSTNALLFSEGENEPIKTFSIGYQGEYQSYQNELQYAQSMAKTVGADYYEKLLHIDDLIEFLPEMVKLQDEPIADPVCVPVYYVSKLAREKGVTVCQVGEGADELFCGYAGWMRLLELQCRLDTPAPLFMKRLALGALKLFGKEEAFSYERLKRATMGQPIFWGGAEAFTEVQKMRLISPRLRKKFTGYTSWEAIRPIRQRFEEKAWDKSHLNWMSYLDINLRLPELLLMRVDKMSMGVSLEGRVPFLDHKFVELAMSIPTSLKTRGGTTKYMLKKSVRGLIPEKVIDRKKQGFAVPLYEWYSDKLGKTIRKELDTLCEQMDFFDRSEVFRLLDQKNGASTWYLLNFALWWKTYVAD